ncbi:caskin-1-like protein, partial [Lates japonicus]
CVLATYAWFGVQLLVLSQRHMISFLDCWQTVTLKLLGAAKRVNVNIQDADGLSPLHHAALSGNKELISLLLEAQAAVDIKDHK